MKLPSFNELGSSELKRPDWEYPFLPSKNPVWHNFSYLLRVIQKPYKNPIPYLNRSIPNQFQTFLNQTVNR